jgi:iron complex transport system substrate-binding protein
MEVPVKRVLLLVASGALVAAACSTSGGAATTTTTTMATTTTTTTMATTTTATTAPDGGIVPGQDPDVDAVVNTYEIVFSSETGYDEKAPYIDDPAGLEETVAAYQETGESMGGVALLPTAVVINGQTADVTYDLLFGGTPTYPDLTGDAVLIDDTWKVTRVMFCAMMTSARVGCPES